MDEKPKIFDTLEAEEHRKRSSEEMSSCSVDKMTEAFLDISMHEKPKGYDRFESVYLFEKHRKKSFKEWPFDENSSCSVDKMAEAGFYWCGDKIENDTVKCFVCGKTLTGWDPKDDPWQEHKSHAPQCLFVKYYRKEGDLTVEEFLNIFDVVIKNDMLHKLNTIKNKFLRKAKANLEKFQSQRL